jgi:hypothetical protein
VYESIAKEDMRGGLLANENPRETLIKAEQLGSALSDNVVSPVIRPVKPSNLQVYARGFYARVAQPRISDEPGIGSLGWRRPRLCINDSLGSLSRSPCHDLLLTANASLYSLWTAGPGSPERAGFARAGVESPRLRARMQCFFALADMEIPLVM